MFEDVGKKIKKVAKGYFITLTIIGIITGIIFFIIASYAYNEEVWIISGLVTIVVTPVVAWFSAIMLYGFGEIVDTAIISRRSGATTINASKPTQVKTASTTKTAPAKQPTKIDPRAFNPEDCWMCKSCGTKNLNSRTTCWYCDADKG